jgi:peroxiredoxin Q/BCP
MDLTSEHRIPWSRARYTGSVLAEGMTAPEFTLPDQHGNPVMLSEFRGRWVMLWWYVQADTAG